MFSVRLLRAAAACGRRYTVPSSPLTLPACRHSTCHKLDHHHHHLRNEVTEDEEKTHQPNNAYDTDVNDTESTSSMRQEGNGARPVSRHAVLMGSEVGHAMSQRPLSPFPSAAPSYPDVKIVQSYTVDELNQLPSTNLTHSVVAGETAQAESKVSYAEEEQEEERAACLRDATAGYAADVESDVCGTQSRMHPGPAGGDDESSHSLHPERTDAGGELCSALVPANPVTALLSYDRYVPFNSSQAPYSSKIAHLLRQIAQKRGYLSPVWSTREAFARVDIQVRESELNCFTEVVLSLASARLFNLEQTDCCNPRIIDGTALMHAKSAYYDQLDKHAPMDLIGRPIRGVVRSSLIQHVLYDEMCARGPSVWAQLGHIDKLNMRILPSQLRRYVKVTYSEEFSSYISNTRSFNTLSNADSKAMSAASGARAQYDVASRVNYTVYFKKMRDHLQIQYGNMLGVDLYSCSLFYHISQFERSDAAGQSAQPTVLHCSSSKPFVCYSLRGYCMSFTQTYIMQQYCAKYGLPVEGVALFVTQSQMQGFNATLRLISDTLASTDETQPRVINGHVERHCAANSFPEPIDVIINDDIVTMYHALQTDKYLDFMRVMHHYRRKKTMTQIY